MLIPSILQHSPSLFHGITSNRNFWINENLLFCFELSNDKTKDNVPDSKHCCTIMQFQLFNQAPNEGDMLESTN